MKKRNWLRIVSPCILASFFSVFTIVFGLISYNNSEEGWSILFVILAVPLLITFLLADLIAKALTKNTLYLWLTELLIVLIAILLAGNYMFG